MSDEKKCRKAPHTGYGYLHDEDYDGPYDVDGVEYCGRCHFTMMGHSIRSVVKDMINEKTDAKKPEAREESSMDDARIKYMNDPTFHRMVDVIHALLVEAQMTPHEVRQAAIFACTKYEMERPDTPLAAVDAALEEVEG